MTRLTIEEINIRILEDRIQKPSRICKSKEAALSILKERTGQDFGLDASKWRRWFKENNIEIDFFSDE